MRRLVYLVNTVVYSNGENDDSKTKNKNHVWNNKTFFVET